MPTEKGNLTVLFNGFARTDNYGGGRLQAAIRNDTPFKFQAVNFAMYGYDANGDDVWLCGSKGISANGGCDFHLFDAIEPGQTIAIKAPGDFVVFNTSRNAARTDFKIRDTSYLIQYDIKVDPIENEKFAISSHFSPTTGISLDFRNKSSDVIEVAWDQSVYIDEDGNSSRLIRGGVNLAEKDRPQPNTLIPPGTKLQETVFPIGRIQQVTGGKWRQLPILPNEAWIIFDKHWLDQLKANPSPYMYFPGDKHLAGKNVRLFLRLLVNDQKQNVTLTFKIAAMAQ